MPLPYDLNDRKTYKLIIYVGETQSQENDRLNQKVTQIQMLTVTKRTTTTITTNNNNNYKNNNKKLKQELKQ